MQQVSSQLGVFSPMTLNLNAYNAYNAYTQAVSKDVSLGKLWHWVAMFYGGMLARCIGVCIFFYKYFLGFESLSHSQLVQQQALMAQSAYLSPVTTVAAVQMQQMAALNANGIIATPITPITPSSGNK